MTGRTVGVGLLGAGPVTQAIHLPTLARVSETFHVECVMDVDASVAASVAGRVGARWTTDAAELIADDRVEVVVVCSPNGFHAEQVEAAFLAGKKAVLCEKPLATSPAEAQRIAEAAAETGVPLVVGAMHTFDPGWLETKRRWGDLIDTAHTVRSVIVLPPNPRFENLAADVITRPSPREMDHTDPDSVAGTIQGLIMGLAIHDLPLVRVFCGAGADVHVLSSSAPHPSGYLIDFTSAGRSIQLFGVNTANWRPEWTFEAIGDNTAAFVNLPPSYVHAGSASGVVRHADRVEQIDPYAVDGYEAEWRYLADLVRGAAEPLDVSELVRDVMFALEIGQQASQLARQKVLQEAR